MCVSVTQSVRVCVSTLSNMSYVMHSMMGEQYEKSGNYKSSFCCCKRLLFGLAVRADDSCPKGHRFESRRIMDIFFTK